MGGTLVLGCGYTGEALSRKLRARGEDVRATTRSGAASPALHALGVRVEAWTAPSAIDLHGVRLAFALFPPGDADADATAALLQGVPRLVYCSATSVYGAGDVDDDTPPAPASESGSARLRAEDAFRRRGAIVVRAAGIYGPGRNVVERHRAGRLQSSGDLDRPVNLIHVEDLADVLLRAAERAEPGSVTIAADGHPVAWRDLLAVAVHAVGRPVPNVEAPSPGAHVTGEWRRCGNRRMREVLGVHPAFPDALVTLASMYGVQVDIERHSP